MDNSPPPKEVLDNLDLLLNLEVLKNESDWVLLTDLKHIRGLLKALENHPELIHSNAQPPEVSP